MGANVAPPGPKNALFRKIHTFPPKTRFCRTFPFWAQKEQENGFGPVLEPESLLFPREFNDSGGALFPYKKLLLGAEKN